MSTVKINLLPYRAARRKAIAQRFYVFLGISSALALGLLVLVHMFFSLRSTTQESRNSFLENEIKTLDKQIDEIKRLREETAAMISRKQVVESLQANRSRAVLILNQIVQPPSGVFYKNIKQAGDAITLNGLAPSNTAVSALIKQIETSSILTEPKLVETKSVGIDGNRLIEFTLQAKTFDLAKIAAEKEKAAARQKANNNLLQMQRKAAAGPTPPAAPTK